MTEQLGLKELENCLKPLAEGAAVSCEIATKDQNPLELWRVIVQILARPEFASIEAINVTTDDDTDAIWFHKRG